MLHNLSLYNQSHALVLFLSLRLSIHIGLPFLYVPFSNTIFFILLGTNCWYYLLPPFHSFLSLALSSILLPPSFIHLYSSQISNLLPSLSVLLSVLHSSLCLPPPSFIASREALLDLFLRPPHSCHLLQIEKRGGEAEEGNETGK